MGFAVAMQATAPTTRTDLSEGLIVIFESLFVLCFVCFELVCRKIMSLECGKREKERKRGEKR